MFDVILYEYAPPVKPGDIVDEALSLGPRSLLNAGLLPALSWVGVHVSDVAVIPEGLPEKDPGTADPLLDERKRRYLASTRQLARRIERAITQDRIPLTMGDCTAAVGVYTGLTQRWDDVAVVWVDAHCDLNTEESTVSGYLGGMPLAAVLGESLPWLAAGAGMHYPCEGQKVALVGAREFDPYEREFLLGSMITRVTCDELNDSVEIPRAAYPAPSAAIQKVVRVVESAKSVYLHIDADALDPRVMPSVTFPSPGGLSLDSLLALVDAVASSGKARAVTITSFHPRKQGSLKSAATLVPLIAEIAARCEP